MKNIAFLFIYLIFFNNHRFIGSNKNTNKMQISVKMALGTPNFCLTNKNNRYYPTGKNCYIEFFWNFVYSSKGYSKLRKG